MRRTQLSLVLVLVFLGCGSSDDTPTKQASHAPPSLDALKCEVPAAPDMTASAKVVGDGTAASCTTLALRAALETAASISFNCGPDPITLTIDKTLLARDGTRIDGGGKIILDGADQLRILNTDNKATVLLEGLTFQHGHSQTVEGQDGADGSGGAIHRGWQSLLYVRNCSFFNNRADATQGFGGGAIATASSGWTTIINSNFKGNSSLFGGAVYSLLSDLTIVDCKFEANEATKSDGGAIFTDGAYVPPKSEHGTYGGMISICGTRFLDNTALASSGAGFLYAYGIDQLAINRCEFRGNRVSSADPGLGGAIRIDAEAFVQNSLFVDNQTAGQGGALWMGRGPAVFENVTFYANHAALWGGAISYGDKPVALNNCTLARNTAGKGADCLFGSAGFFTAHNTLFANNGEKASTKRHCSSPIEGDHNLAFPAEDGDVCGTTLSHADPLVEQGLEDLGGPTQTLAIREGSPAINAGVTCPATDQRGEARQADQCDLGAFEYTK